MKNLVYAITIDLTGLTEKDFNDVCDQTAKLNADVQRLAKKSGEEIHMHKYNTLTPSSPNVLIECSPAFLGKIAHLPLFGSLHPVDQAQTPTSRCSDSPEIEPPQSQSPKGPGR